MSTASEAYEDLVPDLTAPGPHGFGSAVLPGRVRTPIASRAATASPLGSPPSGGSAGSAGLSPITEGRPADGSANGRA